MHYLPVLLAGVLGLLLSIAAWRVVSQWENHAAEVEFTTRAKNTALILQNGLDESLTKIVALRALFDSAAFVTRREFTTFADEVLNGQDAILSVSWIPRVRRAERAQHEAQAIRDGIRDYTIKALGKDGLLTTSLDREEYFPVYYSTGREAASVYGFDLNDGGPRQQTLESARNRNQFSASEPLELRTGAGDRTGFLIMLPVYHQGLAHNTVDRKREALIGYVQGVFQASVLVSTSLKSLQVPLDLYLFAPGSDRSSMPVHVRYSHPSGEPMAPKSFATLSASEHWTGLLKVADKDWTLIAVPAADAWGLGHGRAWMVLVAGLLISTTIVVYIWSSARHTQRLLQANARNTLLAQTDSLTSLANRSAFFDRLTMACAGARSGVGSYSVLFFDLDHFKEVNDTLGHPIGDLVLQQVAERLKTITGETDVLARLGGDEFAVLQGPSSDPKAAEELAHKIIDAFSTPFSIKGNVVRINASVGISNFCDEQCEPETLMMEADLALYRAKEDGRNCYRLHDKAFEQQVQERVRLAEELRCAIDRSEFELHYQPQVELPTGRIIGLEALVRWNHPTRGEVQPSLFIPIAERAGTITALGKWVFDTACRQTRIWHDLGIAPLTVAVNVSAVQCKSPNLEREMAESMSRWNIDPRWMEIELTESVLMEATQQSDIIERLRRLGLRIAIDDFGTGYSSLSYLTNYPVDRLKIAQQIVFGVPSEVRHAAVVRTAISLAHELGIQCVAEGIENAAQALFLVAANCKYGQGYWYSRPVTVDRATLLLRAGVIRRFEARGDDPVRARA